MSNEKELKLFSHYSSAYCKQTRHLKGGDYHKVLLLSKNSTLNKLALQTSQNESFHSLAVDADEKENIYGSEPRFCNVTQYI